VNEAEKRTVVIPPASNMFSLSKCRAFYVEGEPILYVMGMDDDLQVPGLKNVYAHDYFAGLLIRKASQELDEYLNSHMEDFSIYEKESFWQHAMHCAGYVIIPDHAFIFAHNVEQGFVNMSVSSSYEYRDHYNCTYNLYDKSFTIFRNWRDTTPMSALEYYYGYYGLQEQILAQRQYDAGIIPAPYMETYLEISRINAWLRDKHSVHCLFRNGRKTQTYHIRDLTLHELVRLKDGVIVPYTGNYRYAPCEDAGIPLRFFHYSKELNVNTEAFAPVIREKADDRDEKARVRESRLQAVADMLRGSVRYVYYGVRFSCGDGENQLEFYSGQECTSRETLSHVEDALMYLQDNCAEENLQAESTPYLLGEGDDTPQPIPEDIFEAMQDLSLWEWSELPGYAPQETILIRFNCGYLYNKLSGKGLLQQDIEQSLRRRVILSSMQDGVSYLFSYVTAYCDNHMRTFLLAGHIKCADDTLKPKPISHFAQANLKADTLAVESECYTFGSGAPAEMPEDILCLIAEYGLGELMKEPSLFMHHITSFKVPTEKFGTRTGSSL